MIVLRSILIWTAIGLFFLLNCLATLPVFLLTFWFDRDRVYANRVFMTISQFIMAVVPGGKVFIEGVEHKPTGVPFISVANHISFLDMPALGMLPFKMKWISKKELFWVPVVGWSMFMSGHVYLDRKRKDAIRQLDKIGPTLRRLQPIMMFPEGTRSKDGMLQRFKRGAFVMAREYNAKILPVAITGTNTILKAGGWKFFNGNGVHIKILPPIDPMDFETPELMADFCRSRIELALKGM
jgi:1-acyl-sn-glycerol-3-phosphate acyltransferase